MKKILILLLLIPFIGISQITNRLIVTQNVPLDISANNYMFTVPPNDNRIYVAKMDSLKLHPYNIVGLETYLYLKGDTRYKSITYSPSFVEIISGLGFNPYPASNPSGYISSYTESDPLVPAYAKSLTGFSIIKSDTDPLYVTNARTITINGTVQDLSINRTWTIDKTSVGLGNSDNTSDLNKPISTATQTALNGKQSTLISGTNIKTVGGTSLLGSGDISINNYTPGTGISIASNVITNTAPEQTVTLTGSNRISTTGTHPNFTVAFVEPAINTAVSRTLNSNFTVSTTKQATINYSVTCSVTNPLVAGSSTASVFLEYSTNGGSTWLLLSQNSSTSSVALAVAVAITNVQTSVLTGVVPANALVRLRSTTSGTASVTYVTGTEIY